ncbi:MAG: YkvA family protein [Halanaerobacter sp.]
MSSLQILRSMIKNIKLVYQYIKDPEVSILNKGLAILPIIYIISPFDGDFIPVIGWLDDALVAVVIWGYILNKLKDHRNDSKQTKSCSQDEVEADYEFKDDEYDIE